MNEDATTMTAEELKANAQKMMERAREIEREAEIAIQRQKDETKRRERIAVVIGTIQSFGPRIREIHDAVSAVLGKQGVVVKEYGQEPEVTAAVNEYGSLQYSFVYGRMSLRLHYNPTVYKGGTWHGRYVSVGVVGMRIEGYVDGRRINRLASTTKWEGAEKKMAAKAMEVRKSEDAFIESQLKKETKKTSAIEAIRKAFESSPSLTVKIEPVMRQQNDWKRTGPYLETGAYTVTVASTDEKGAVTPIQTFYDVRVDNDGKVKGNVTKRVSLSDYSFEKVG